MAPTTLTVVRHGRLRRAVAAAVSLAALLLQELVPTGGFGNEGSGLGLAVGRLFQEPGADAQRLLDLRVLRGVVVLHLGDLAT